MIGRVLAARALRSFADGFIAVVLPAYLLALGLGLWLFTMLVIMRKPKGDALQQEGTFAAAPVWKQIAQEILVRWQMTP